MCEVIENLKRNCATVMRSGVITHASSTKSKKGKLKN